MTSSSIGIQISKGPLRFPLVRKMTGHPDAWSFQRSEHWCKLQVAIIPQLAQSCTPRQSCMCHTHEPCCSHHQPSPFTNLEASCVSRPHRRPRRTAGSSHLCSIYLCSTQTPGGPPARAACSIKARVLGAVWCTRLASGYRISEAGMRLVMHVIQYMYHRYRLRDRQQQDLQHVCHGCQLGINDTEDSVVRRSSPAGAFHVIPRARTPLKLTSTISESRAKWYLHYRSQLPAIRARRSLTTSPSRNTKAEPDNVKAYSNHSF